MTAAKKPEADAPPPAESADPFAGLVPGRVLHYWPTPSEERQTQCPGPWAAMCTKVSAATPGEVTINLQVPSPTPIGSDPVQRREKVAFAPDGEDPAGRWRWIPRE